MVALWLGRLPTIHPALQAQGATPVRDWAADALPKGFKLLLTVLRYELLRTPQIETKISVCSVIQDCAHAFDATRSHNSSSAIQLPSKLLNIFKVIASRPDDKNSLGALISLLDGLTTSLRLANPNLTATCRRALEVVAEALGLEFPCPAHLEVDGSDLSIVPSNFPWGWPAIPNQPARPARMMPETETSIENVPWATSVRTKLFNIEITAAEICAAIPLLYPELPAELDVLLALQTYDEGRHAHQLRDALRRHGLDEETGPTGQIHIWDNMRLGTSLVEAICIEQILGEGYSIGTDLCLAQMFEDQGYPDMAEVHRSVHSDEFMHASQGLVWFNRLTGPGADTIIASLEPRFANSPPSEPWFRADLRAQAGFSVEQIERQRKLAQPVEM